MQYYPEVNDWYDLSHHSDPFGSLERSQIHGHVVQGDPNPRETHPGMSLMILTAMDPITFNGNIQVAPTLFGYHFCGIGI